VQRRPVDDQRDHGEDGEREQGTGGGSDRAASGLRCLLRRRLRHPRRVYQGVAGILAALALGACGEAPPRFGATESDGLVLVRVIGGSKEIVRVRLADAAARQVTATPHVDETWPYWSGIARRLVYQASSGDRSHDLLLWNPEHDSTRAIARSPGRDEQWPAWSPREARLAFAFRGGRPPSGLVLADVASHSQRLLVPAGEADFFLRPSFAPDGTRLVAQRRGADGRGSQIWAIGLDGAARALTSDPAWADIKPCYTRDGAAILFSRRPAAGGPYGVFTLPAQGGVPRPLASTAGISDHSARPSPKRDEFVFVSDRDGRSALWLAAGDGGGLRRLSHDETRGFYAPHWSPDGERIVAIATPMGVGSPKLAEPDSLAGTHTLVFDREGHVLFDAPGFMPDWMPPWREP